MINDYTPKTVKKIQFSILSPTEIQKLSVTDRGIVSCCSGANGKRTIRSIFDPRMGVTNEETKCETCFGNIIDCPGHFGHINLAEPVFHNKFMKKVLQILQCVCFSCSKLLISALDPKIKEILKKTANQLQNRLDLVHNLCKAIKKCKNCSFHQPELKVNEIEIIAVLSDQQNNVKAEDVSIIFQKITDNDSTVLGMNPKIVRPEWMILTVLPVSPPVLRLKIQDLHCNSKGQDNELNNIILVNNIHFKLLNKKNPNEEELADNLKLLQKHVTIFIDNEIKRVSGVNKPRLNTVANQSHFRKHSICKNLLSKYVNFCGRTIITPDPNLQIDEIGIPRSMAKKLTFPEIVTTLNIVEMRKLANTELQLGHFVERQLKDGDIVVLNQQPSWKRVNMMSYKVKILPSSTFRLNVSCVTLCNANFDGDEATLHVPQSIETCAEVNSIQNVTKQIISPSTSKPDMSLGEDALIGIRTMAKKNVFIEKDYFMNFLMSLSNWNGRIPQPSIIKPKPLWTGKQLLSMVIPKYINVIDKIDNDFCYQDWIPSDDKDVIVQHGELIMGVLSQKLLDTSAGSLLHVCLIESGHEVCKKLYKDFQSIAIDWLLLQGASFSVGDAIGTPEMYLFIAKEIKKAKDEIIETLQKVYSNYTLILDPGFTGKTAVELRILNINEELYIRCVKIAMKFLPETNILKDMIFSDPRIYKPALRCFMALVGQKTINRQRISFGFYRRSLPHFVQNDHGPESRGMIENPYVAGLTPSEFYFDAMEGRFRIVNAVERITEINSLQHSLIKTMESVMVEYDGTVRNSSGQLIQLCYGDDGLSGEAVEFQNLPSIKVNDTIFQNQFKYKEDQWLQNVTMNTTDLSTSLESEWDQLQLNRKTLQKIYPGLEPKVLLPCNLQRMISIVSQIQKDPNIEKTELNPIKVIDSVKNLLEKCKVGPYDSAPVLFSFLVRSTLCTNRVFNEFGLSEESFDWLVAEIEKKYQQAVCPPGEMVGVLASQSLVDNVTLGVPSRLKEILKLTNSDPFMSVFLNGEAATIREDAIQVIRQIEQTSLEKISSKHVILYDPDPRNTKIKEDQDFVNVHLDENFKDFSSIKVSPWLLRVEFNQKYLDEKKISVKKIVKIIHDNFGNDLLVIHNDNLVSFLERNLVLRIRMLNWERYKLSSGIDKEEKALFQCVVDKLMELTVHGVKGIVNIYCQLENEEWCLKTNGTNLFEVLTKRNVNGRKTYSGNVIENFKVLGIEAARKSLEKELSFVLTFNKVHVNYRHLSLICDVMTMKGYPTAITHYKTNTGPLGRCIIKKSIDVLLNSAVHCDKEHLKGLSEKIMLGQKLRIGTGCFDLLPLNT